MTKTEQQLSMGIELNKRALASLEEIGDSAAELIDAHRSLILRLELALAQATNRRLKGAAVKAAKAPRCKRSKVVEVRNVKMADWTRHGVKHEGETAEGHHATIAVGQSIRLHGVETNLYNGPEAYDRTFEIGDTVAVDSYNLTYLGTITGIGAKTVTIEETNMGRTKRLSLYEFSYRNRRLNLEKIAADNAETHMCI